MSKLHGHTQREDYRATGDPALFEPARRGQAQLLTYRELYLLWERQQWRTQDLDFRQDAIDWRQRVAPRDRFNQVYGTAVFFAGEQRVTSELGPMMRASPDEEMRIFLCTQIADEARHVAFFDRFHAEVGVLGSDGLSARLEQASGYLSEGFHRLFDEMLARRIDRLARAPEDLATLVEAVTLYHMVIEGVLALTGQYVIITFNERAGTLPAFVEGFQKVARDEHRHLAFGARFLCDVSQADHKYRRAVERTLSESLPVADSVLIPPWYGEQTDYFGFRVAEVRQFARQALDRRLKAIGIPLYG